jgi:hypothetical protein
VGDQPGGRDAGRAGITVPTGWWEQRVSANAVAARESQLQRQNEAIMVQAWERAALEPPDRVL